MSLDGKPIYIRSVPWHEKPNQVPPCQVCGSTQCLNEECSDWIAWREKRGYPTSKPDLPKV